MKKKGFNLMACIAGVLLIFIGAILVYWNIPYSPNQSEFKNKISERLNTTPDANELYTSEEIKHLPAAMQRYFNYTGLIGTPNIMSLIFNLKMWIFNLIRIQSSR